MKALLVQEFGADVGQLVLRRDVVDADDAVVHKLSYVKEAKSDMFGPFPSARVELLLMCFNVHKRSGPITRRCRRSVSLLCRGSHGVSWLRAECGARLHRYEAVRSCGWAVRAAHRQARFSTNIPFAVAHFTRSMLTTVRST